MAKFAGRFPRRKSAGKKKEEPHRWQSMDEILKEFLVESYEGLDQLDRDLVSLEQDPSSEEILGRIFRTIHTIKGSSGFLALTKLEKIAHVGENLLSLLREGKKSLTAEIISTLLSMADAIREILGHLELDEKEGNTDYADLVQRITKLSSGEEEAKSSEDDEPSESDSPSESTSATSEHEATDSKPASQASPAPDASPSTKNASSAAVSDVFRTSVSDSSIRVDVGLLDKLMNLVGELVLARNQILQYTATQEDSNFLSTSQRLNLVTTELQEGVMKTRMQPIGNVWTKFPRVVRDLALACGKKVRLEMRGRETELDKTIIESIKDPLTHVIRNSVDHGIEPPEVRLERGKPEEGLIELRAFHEGGQVNIEISDDGGGIDPERVRTKAIEKSLVTPERAARMTERELVNLVALPGFSTAPEITNVSGRGVGMDVVKTNIEKIGGTIDIHSVQGVGTTLKIKIPLTLAIIPALIVTSGGDRFAIPQVNLLELVRLEGDHVSANIDDIHGAPVYRLRGNLLPLAFLNQELGRAAPHDWASRRRMGEESPDQVINIVVLQADEQQFGLVVESILDTEEIVVKPLGKQLKSVAAFAGAAIMGDGRVALILDVIGLAQKAEIISENRDTETVSTVHHQETSDNRETLLLLSTGGAERVAIQLSMVARLEEFESKAIESTAGQEVVQYRDEIMPLVRLSRVLGHDTKDVDPDSPLPVVVVRSENGRSIGLVVDQILDIVDEEIHFDQHQARAGIRGATTLEDRVTDLLDVHAILRSALPGFVQRADATMEV